jgi:hypothetical protein
MSLPSFPEIKCGNCQHLQFFFDWLSVSSFGSPDLDTRPPEEERSAIFHCLVKRCEKCGYCGSSIDKATPDINCIITSVEYLNQLGDTDFPSVANSLLCKALILEDELKFEEAAWATLHAAWCCDDNNRDEQSVHCRNRAIDLFILALHNGAIASENIGNHAAVMVDVYRRNSLFDTAMKLCMARIRLEKDGELQQVLQFQAHMIGDKDTRAFTVEYAQNYLEIKQTEVKREIAEFNAANESSDDRGKANLCHACHESPCMCVDDFEEDTWCAACHEDPCLCSDPF